MAVIMSKVKILIICYCFQKMNYVKTECDLFKTQARMNEISGSDILMSYL